MSEEELKKVEMFSLKGTRIKAKFCQIYDGDTCKAVFPFAGKEYRWSCRLNGIDTPELRTKNKEEKKMGIKARDYLRSLLNGKELEIECSKFDKYGRLLITIYSEEEGVTINQMMINNGYAKEYYGKKKEVW